MKYLKKPLALILSILLTAVISFTALAETSFSDGKFEFVKTDKGNGLITGCDLQDENITVPEFVLEYPIAGIGDYAFMSMPKLKTVTLPAAVVSIGEYAFAENPQLESVTVSKYCNKIADSAFANSPNITIIGFANSYAEAYAKENNITFTARNPEQPTEPDVTSPTAEPTSEKPSETSSTEPVTTAPATEKPSQAATEPADSEPDTTAPAEQEPTAPAASSKKANPIKISVKAKTVKLKKLRKKAQKIKPVTVKNAQGKVAFKLIKKGSTAKLFKLSKISSKGVITLKRWKKAVKGNYKIKIKITAKGNSKYNRKTVTKTAKIKVK